MGTCVSVSVLAWVCVAVCVSASVSVCVCVFVFVGSVCTVQVLVQVRGNLAQDNRLCSSLPLPPRLSLGFLGRIHSNDHLLDITRVDLGWNNHNSELPHPNLFFLRKLLCDVTGSLWNILKDQNRIKLLDTSR